MMLNQLANMKKIALIPSSHNTQKLTSHGFYV